MRTMKTMKNWPAALSVQPSSRRHILAGSREEVGIKPRVGFISLLIQLMRRRYHARETRYKGHRHQLPVCIIEHGRCNDGATCASVTGRSDKKRGKVGAFSVANYGHASEKAPALIAAIQTLWDSR